MIIIKLNGGLGNQMFQYSFGRALSLRYKQKLFIDRTSYNIKNANVKRRYCLDFFNINVKSFSSITLIRLFLVFNFIYHKFFKNNFIIKEKNVYFYDDNIKIRKMAVNYIDGYWQSYKYFEDFNNFILTDFTLKECSHDALKKIDCSIKNSTSISIHVRRGDYVGNKDYEVCSSEYYQKSINYFQSKYLNSVFYVFSDDVGWVKNNLKFKNKAEFVSDRGLNDAEELILMSHCQHNIISNSSFSWWGAWLNKNINKEVLAPSKWSNVPSLREVRDLLPKDWIKII